MQDYLNVLSKENHSISKWNLGGQVYLDYIKLEQRAQYLFSFDNKQKSAGNGNALEQNELSADENNFSNQVKDFLFFIYKS